MSNVNLIAPKGEKFESQSQEFRVIGTIIPSGLSEACDYVQIKVKADSMSVNVYGKKDASFIATVAQATVTPIFKVRGGKLEKGSPQTISISIQTKHENDELVQMVKEFIKDKANTPTLKTSYDLDETFYATVTKGKDSKDQDIWRVALDKASVITDTTLKSALVAAE